MSAAACRYRWWWWCSWAATAELAPKLEGALAAYQRRGDSMRYHDLAFTEYGPSPLSLVKQTAVVDSSSPWPPHPAGNAGRSMAP